MYDMHHILEARRPGQERKKRHASCSVVSKRASGEASLHDCCHGQLHRCWKLAVAAPTGGTGAVHQDEQEALAA